ncbi:polyprenyl synthetase family protein [Pararhizobium mangrovi]|uniref:Probable farnesyl diphosphate synthase n=1 Tax=Pararhizobium mangrovi TaxID=2590452 RepID=A0A506UCR1_9HYPH|nr:farnesyl diphosphate synthase [Pararhizobium mangrovi]TPW30744.1 polyprenyl synthetase family protein [Pararhizobium mangrovi]
MTDNAADITDRIASTAAEVGDRLAELLADRRGETEGAPTHLMAAIRHGALNGGKRIRPFLVLETARLFRADREAAMRVALALECVHCYSLVHDDLPAMDDDTLRRGQPTVHVAHGEAQAILAGDGLQTLAFEIVANARTRLPAEVKVALVAALAHAAGPAGMAGGQALDLASEHETRDEAAILRLQGMKTGALLTFACEAGAIIAGTGEDDRERMAAFGRTIGIAFQLADDLLDVTADTKAMGKATGKDAGRGKATLVGLNGTGWARKRLDALVDEATTLLAPYGARGETLAETARFVADRRN